MLQAVCASSSALLLCNTRTTTCTNPLCNCCSQLFCAADCRHPNGDCCHAKLSLLLLLMQAGGGCVVLLTEPASQPGRSHDMCPSPAFMCSSTHAMLIRTTVHPTCVALQQMLNSSTQCVLRGDKVQTLTDQLRGFEVICQRNTKHSC